jgi:6-phosphogluconolactonase
MIVDPTGSYLLAVDNSMSTQVYAYALSSGSLTAIPGSPFPVGSYGAVIDQMVIDPTGTYLYAIDTANSQLLGYSSSGSAFAPIAGSPFTTPGTEPLQLSMDPSGKYVFVSFEDTQEVWTYTIESGGSTPGALTPSQKMRLRTSFGFGQLLLSGSAAVTFTPQYLYVANSGSGNIGQFGITASSGALSSLGAPVGAGTSPYDVAADSNPALPFLYAANEGSANISGYQIGANGALSALPDSPYATGDAPEWLVVDQTGGYVYNVNSTPGTLTSFAVNANSGTAFGDLSSYTFGGSAEVNCDFVTLDPNDLFVFTLGSPMPAPYSGIVDSFLLSGNGTPTTISASQGPSGAAVHPSGEYIYVANSGTNLISEFSVNASSGALTSIGTVQVPIAGSSAGLSSVVVEPSGQYLFASDQNANLVYIYSINPSTGALTAASTPSIGTGSGPYALAVDISGSYLYVSNFTSNDISIFAIDLATGGLTAVGTSTTPTGGTSPRGLATKGTMQ